MKTMGSEWITSVPAMFRSAAQSIEGHREQCVGDPAALIRTADDWRVQAAAMDESWAEVSSLRQGTLRHWEGAAAEGFGERAAVAIGQLSANATALRFAADGLDLAAAALTTATQSANQTVRSYASQLRQLYSWAQGVPAPQRAQAIRIMINRGDTIGGEAIRHLARFQAQLDAVLASMPRRFTLGPQASWRKGIQSVTLRARDESFGGAVTAFSVRVNRREGMNVSVGLDGRVLITLSDSYAGGLHGSVGGKISLNDLPSDAKGIMKRLYAEAEAAAVTGYALRYRFASVEEAQRFIDRLEGSSWWEKAVSNTRDAVGFVAGPIADGGAARTLTRDPTPWHTMMTGREPDETVVSMGTMAKVSGDVGVSPVLSGQATAGLDRHEFLTVKSTGGYARSSMLGGNAKIGGTALAWTENLGSGGDLVVKTDYDKFDNPTRYTVQKNQLGSFDHHAGSNNTGIGTGDLGNGISTGVRSVDVKVDSEGFVRKVESYSLDLTDPDNRSVFQHDPQQLPDQIRRRGVLTTQEYNVSRQSWEPSAKVGLAGLTFGGKFGQQHEQQVLVNESYTDFGAPTGHGASGSGARPIPRDPR